MDCLLVLYIINNFNPVIKARQRTHSIFTPNKKAQIPHKIGDLSLSIADEPSLDALVFDKTVNVIQKK